MRDLIMSFIGTIHTYENLAYWIDFVYSIFMDLLNHQYLNKTEFDRSGKEQCNSFFCARACLI